MTMKFNPDRCPKCGGYAMGTGETIPGVAMMSREDDGTFEYDGETEVGWDGQTTDTSDDGKVELWCGGWHSWFAELLTAKAEAIGGAL